MFVDFAPAVQEVKKRNLPIACLDTCVWLDFLRGRYEAKQARDLFAKLKCRSGIDFTIVIPDQVQIEFKRNKDEAVYGYVSQLKEISTLFAKFHEDFLDAIDPTLVLLNGDFDQAVRSCYELPVMALLNSSVIYKPLSGHYEAAGLRSCLRKAPSKRRSSSSADSLIVESFIGLVANLRSSGFSHNAYFVTVNTSDFSDEKDKLAIHGDLDAEFTHNGIQYVCDSRRFIHMKAY